MGILLFSAAEVPYQNYPTQSQGVIVGVIDKFASSGRAISSAGSMIISLETIDQTETGRRWLTM